MVILRASIDARRELREENPSAPGSKTEIEKVMTHNG